MLTWRDIEYSITVNDKKDHNSVTSRTLLHPMSGEALPGELLAVMGTSGETVLLTVICDIDITQSSSDVIARFNFIYCDDHAYILQGQGSPPCLMS